MSEKVYTKNAPDAIGPYSQAVKTGNLVFTSGQIAINPSSGNVEATTIEEQTHQVCKNLKAVLEEAGTSLDKVVKTVCFLKNMEDFGAFNGIYGEYFTENRLVLVSLQNSYLRMFWLKLKLLLNYNN